MKRWIMVLVLLLLGCLYPQLRVEAANPPEVYQTDQFEYTIADDGISISKYIGQSTDVVIPRQIDGKDVTKIGGYAFEGLKTLNTVTLPDSVVKIGSNSFSGTSIKEIRLSKNLKVIGDEAFKYAHIEKIDFPASLETIERYAFNQAYISQMTFQPTTQLTIKEGAFYNAKFTSLVLPEGLTDIGEIAFYHIEQLKEVVFPTTLRTIERSAFSQSGLEKMTLPAGVQVIGKNAFEDNALETLTLPKTVTSIGKNAFNGNALKTVDIQGPLTTIPEFAFNDNDIQTLTLPNTLETIEEGAFMSNALENVQLPNSLKIINKRAFAYNELTQLNMPTSLETIGMEAFSNNALKEVVIPNHVTAVGIGAFAHNYIKQFSLPDNMTVIPARLFQENLIGEIVLNDRIESVGDRAFYNNNIQQVTVGQKTTDIGAEAFAHNKVNKVQLKAVQNIGKQAFMHNALREVTLSAGIETIQSQAFAENWINEMLLPVSLRDVAQDFLGNANTQVETSSNEYRLLWNGLYTDKALTNAWSGQPGVTVYTKWHRIPYFSQVKNAYVPQGSTIDLASYVKAYDEVDGDITNRLRIKGTVDTKTIGTYPVTYIVTSSTGYEATYEVMFKVTKNAKPVIEGLTEQTVAIGEKLYPRRNVTIYDEEDGDLLQFAQIDIPSTKFPGRFNMNYEVTDSNQNTTTFTRVVYVMPNRVTNVETTSFAKSLDVYWDAQQRVTGYKVYVYDGKGKLLRTEKTSLNGISLTKLKAGTNYRIKVRSYVRTSDKTLLSDYSKVVSTITLPQKPTLTLKPISKGFKASWTKSTTATKYKLSYSLKKDFKDVTTVTTSSKTVAKNVKNLKKGKTYYVRVRAVQTFNNKQYYSTYSTVKKIKVQ
ncbi:leucine-rich repeat protein [Kurthia massiliensis]|uniref:leucine-rich repeat protein n=1 Tax=Kurthia massiliensis TaxID=1033739 RepID=UPI000474AD9E|nr:leucine-rich repeat protein [Kurthia massiliensis]